MVAVARAVLYLSAEPVIIVIAAIAGAYAEPWLGEDGVGYLELGILVVLTFLVGRLADAEREVWCFGLGAFAAVAVGGAADAYPIGQTVLLSAGTALGTVVVGGIGYGFSARTQKDVAEAVHRREQPSRTDPGEVEQGLREMLERRGRARFSWLPVETDEETERRRPGPIEVDCPTGDAAAVRVRANAIILGRDPDDEWLRGWTVDQVERDEPPMKAVASISREWRISPAALHVVADDLREALSLGDPTIIGSAAGELVVVVDGPIEPEAAGYGALIGGPILVGVIAVVLGIATWAIGERGVDALMLAVGIAIVAWLLVASAGRWLLPRLPWFRERADGAWWAALLLLPTLGALGSFVGRLAAE